ncbi:MAG: nucleotidyltransferase family protein [Acidobacteriota bacterium]|nr:nucleotidyltransferase family protein [Acidobacteriota bacterium]
MSPINHSSVIGRAEHELLICCARTILDASAAERIRSLAGQQLDWDDLFRLASRHKLSPLLCWHLKTIAAEFLTPPIQERLRNSLSAISRRNLQLSAELLNLLQLFQQQNIRAIPYKGPVLAETVYGNLALREFVDLDVLVRKCDVLAARDLLIARGYRPFVQLAASQESAFLDYQCEHVLSDDGRDVMVEIQWRVVPDYFSFRFEYESLWQRTVPAAFCQRSIATLSPEDTLLILCVHGSKHLWSRLIWICDVAETVRQFRHQLNWQLIEQRAALSGSRRMLHLGLFLAQDLLAAELPEEIRQRVFADEATKALAEDVYSRLWPESEEGEEDDGQEEAAGFFESSLFHLKAKERWRDRLRFCIRVLTTTTIEDWSPNDDFRSVPLAVQIRRSVRLVRKYLPQLFRLLFSRAA